ncbi:MAG: peptidylprolyl isomerase [candidate division WOR-3 bacterium]
MHLKYKNICLVVVGVLLVIGCKGKKQTPPPKATQVPTETTQVTKPYDTTNKQVTDLIKQSKYMVISVKIGDENIGKIKIELFTNEAPKTTENIKTLVAKGFYDGLTFHRVVPGFVIQGGDPKGDGTGGPGYTTPAEISPKLKHLRGTVAMARLGDQVNPKRESSGSQFYICLANIPHLDGAYTIIGQVVAGMDVVDKIAAVKTGPNDRPITPVVMEKVELE